MYAGGDIRHVSWRRVRDASRQPQATFASIFQAGGQRASSRRHVSCRPQCSAPAHILQHFLVFRLCQHAASLQAYIISAGVCEAYIGGISAGGPKTAASLFCEKTLSLGSLYRMVS